MTRFIILALAVISTVYGADEFKYPTTGDACVLAKFDADFRLSITEGTETKDASWSLPAAASVDVVGSCGTISDPSTLTLTFNDSDTELLFTISESSGGEVSADLQYLLKDPSKIFPGINFTDPISLVGDGQEFADMGTANMSYRCVAPEFAQLTSNQTNVTAEANITFTNLQVQGFGVNASKFSDAFPCSMDNTSTTTQTPQTTTPMPPSGVGNYTLKTDNGTEVCLRLEANISITVHYSDKKGQMMNRTVMVPADAEVNGTCGSMETNLMLTFSDEAEMTKTATLEFIYTKEKGYAFISTVNVDIEFSDANETFSRSLVVKDVLAQSENYYQCKDEVYPFDDGEVMLQDLKEQVFNLKDGAFGKTGVECNAPPPKSPSAGNYSVQGSDNVTCISMDAAIGLKITYLTTENKNETVTLNFTKDEPAGGHCSEGNRTDESILIGFRRGKFSVEFIFVKDKASVSASLDADASPGFYVKDITVNYLLEQEYFPKVKDEGASVTAKLTDAKLFETASERYYKCSASSSVKINDNVDLVTQDLRIQAFNTDTKGPNLYGDNADECSADTDTNSIVPIAVGAALAGLVVIVLIAYLIGRRRNKKGYESV